MIFHFEAPHNERMPRSGAHDAAKTMIEDVLTIRAVRGPRGSSADF